MRFIIFSGFWILPKCVCNVPFWLCNIIVIISIDYINSYYYGKEKGKGKGKDQKPKKGNGNGDGNGNGNNHRRNMQ